MVILFFYHEWFWVNRECISKQILLLTLSLLLLALLTLMPSSNIPKLPLGWKHIHNKNVFPLHKCGWKNLNAIKTRFHCISVQRNYVSIVIWRCEKNKVAKIWFCCTLYNEIIFLFFFFTKQKYNLTVHPSPTNTTTLPPTTAQTTNTHNMCCGSGQGWGGVVQFLMGGAHDCVEGQCWGVHNRQRWWWVVCNGGMAHKFGLGWV